MNSLDSLSHPITQHCINLGVLFDQNLTLDKHVHSMVQSFFHCLRNVSKIRLFYFCQKSGNCPSRFPFLLAVAMQSGLLDLGLTQSPEETSATKSVSSFKSLKNSLVQNHYSVIILYFMGIYYI